MTNSNILKSISLNISKSVKPFDQSTSEKILIGLANALSKNGQTISGRTIRGLVNSILKGIYLMVKPLDSKNTSIILRALEIKIGLTIGFKGMTNETLKCLLA